VEQIIDTLSESISQLILVVITYQEQNAAPPPQLPIASGQVAKTARVLVDVAKQLAEEDYGDYPAIKSEIIEAADQVSVSSDGLVKATTTLTTSTNRQLAWDGLVESCKVISGKTILLLQIVYGAELKRIFAAAQQTKDAFAKADSKIIANDAQCFADSIGDACTKANQLAEYLRARGKDEESEYLRKELAERAQELETKVHSKIAFQVVISLIRATLLSTLRTPALQIWTMLPCRRPTRRRRRPSMMSSSVHSNR
jgi:hypothetical protein